MLEAYPDYWRKVPNVQWFVFKSMPEATTRLAMVKQGEADVAYGLFGTLAEEVRRDPRLKLEVVPGGGATNWVSFVDQYNPKSPWADKRVRLAANHAVNWPAINDAEMLGYAVLTGSIIPRRFAFALPLESYGYAPAHACQLLKEAGYPHGFDAGECSTDTPYATLFEAIVNDLTAVGIHTKVRPMERAAWLAAQRDSTIMGLTRQASAAMGNAVTRIEAFMYSQGDNRSCTTLTLTRSTVSRAPNAIARSVRHCSPRFSARRTTRYASCPCGSRLDCPPQVHASRCQG